MIINLNDNIKRVKIDAWGLGNDVLYKLCKDHPHHKTTDEIGAKIWLIGRAYAASIERRKIKEAINDDYYDCRVIPMIKKSGIDQWIKNSKDSKDCLSAHKKTTNLFRKISGLEKRSLASKYLHFHKPDKFFIYDSRVAGAINNLLEILKIKYPKHKTSSKTYDRNYSHFFNKCLVAQKEILKRYNQKLKPRELDTLLIEIANNKLRKKRTK